MTLIQNEDNKCPTTKQVNDALKSMEGVQTLVLTTQDLIYPGRSSDTEINSADSAVMEIVKSNMTDKVPFQLLYYGVSNNMSACSSLPIIGLPTANVFTLYVNVNQSTVQYFVIVKDIYQKWMASPLNNF